jgi:hypothetical protein
MVGRGGPCVGRVAPGCERSDERLAIADRLVQRGDLGELGRVEPLDLARAAQCLARALGVARAVARERRDVKPDLASPLRVGGAQHLGFALVQIERAAPVLHRFEQALERAQCGEVRGVRLECGGVVAARACGRGQAVPVDVGERAQERAPVGGIAVARAVELALERFRDVVPAPEPLGGPAQAVQRIEICGIAFERHVVGVECRGGAAQRLLADRRQLEPVGRAAADPREAPRESPLELDPAAVGAQQAQAHALDAILCIAAEQRDIFGIEQRAQVGEGSVGSREVGVVGERELAAQLAPAVVEHRSRIERGELALGVTRPGSDASDRTLGVGERGEDLHSRRASGGHEPLRDLPMARGGLRFAQLGKVERRQLAVQIEVGADLHEQRLERLRALRVPSELALEGSAQTQRLGVRSRGDQRRKRAPLLARLAQQRRALEVTARRCPARCRRSLRFERTHERFAVAELAVRAGDLRKHLGIVWPLAAQPLEPGKRRCRRDPLPCGARRALDLHCALGGGPVGELARFGVEPLAPALLALEERGELAAQLDARFAARIDRERRPVAVDRGGRSRERTREQTRLALMPFPALVRRLACGDARVEQRERVFAAAERLGDRERCIERAAVARRELEHARRVHERIRGRRGAQSLDQLEAHRHLRGPGEMAQLRLEQLDQRLAATLRAVQLAQRRLDRAIARALGERAAVGFGGFVRLVDAQVRVAQAGPPVRALCRGLARHRRIAAQLDQVGVIVSALIGGGERLGHQCIGSELFESDLECGDRALEVVEVRLADVRDLEPQRGAVAGGVRIGAVDRREPRLEQSDEVLVAVLLLVAALEEARGRRVRGREVEDPLVVRAGALGLRELAVERSQARAQLELARVVGTVGQLRFECARAVVRALRSLVVRGERLPEIAAARVERDRALEVQDLTGGIGEALRAQAREAFVQTGVDFGGPAPERSRPVVAQRRPALEPLEQPLAVLRRVSHHVAHLASGDESIEDRECVLGAVEPFLEQQCALESEMAALRLAAAALLILEETGESVGVDARAQCALEPGARLARVGCVGEHAPIHVRCVLGTMQVVLQDRCSAQIERGGRGSALVRGGAPREPLRELLVAARASEQGIDPIAEVRAAVLRLGAQEHGDRASQITAPLVEIRELE